jgi:hypothetical protein
MTTMPLRRRGFPVLPAFVAMYLPFCATEVRLTTRPPDAPPATLWEEPVDLADRDLFHGPWGREHAPDPGDRYTLVHLKHSGVNPGLTVRDSAGREWSVKQAFDESADEAPVEVVLSRVLSALGYHQPPVYYLRSFTLEDHWGSHVEAGGRFRLKVKALKDRGQWSWQQNPFVGSRPYQGLLVILMLFNGSDLKNSNNTVYEHRSVNGLEHWYVARDVGTALGSTGRLAPEKGNAEAFERDRFIVGVRDGFVDFDYGGWHQELVRGRLTPADVGWAGDLLARLGDRQWHDAFRAGGYTPDVTERFVRALRRRIDETRHPGRAAVSAGTR